MKKKLILMTLAIAGLCFTSQAQKGQNRKANKENRVNKFDSFAKVYGLTETQKTEFKKASKTKRESMKALKAQNLNDKKQVRAKRKVITETFDAEVKTIFTSAQYLKYTAEKETRKKAKREKHKVNRINRRADSMKSKYNLSSDQHAKLKTALTASSAKRAAVAAKYKDSENKEAKKAEMKALGKDLNTQIQGILTAEQFKNWKADKKERRKSKKSKKE